MGAVSSKALQRSLQFTSIQPRIPQPIAPQARLLARMMLYRFYAFVGRQKLGWGLRARLRGTLRAGWERSAGLWRKRWR